jgi:energy-coupling factor transport system ATP-binding protein
MIDLSNVTYSYPNSPRPALKEATLTIQAGEFVLVVGASGSGKSTLLRCFNGLVPHFHGGTIQGRVRVFGRNPIEVGPRGMGDLVGFVFQDPETQFVTERVEDELAFAMENHNLPLTTMRRRIEEVLDQLSIAHLRERRIDTLSGGERQRVSIGSVLTLQPSVLVLDEPTSQLDPQAAEEVLTTLQKLNEDLGLTVIISEHRLERVAQYADRICYLPGAGKPLLLDESRAVLAQIPLAPPLARLGRALGWTPLPLTIKEARPHAGELKRRLKPAKPAANGDAGSNGKPVISVKDVWFRYRETEALKRVNLSVAGGEFLALMGRNGSGKSTLLKNMVGLLKPDQGQIMVLDQNTKKTALTDITRRVGFVPQNPGRLLFKETLADELAFTRGAHNLPLRDPGPLLKQLSLEEHAHSYPRDLSSGERQRAALAAILAAEPQILLLDEPTRGLDYANKTALLNQLRQLQAQGITIIMATHDVELVARCAGRVVLMGEGEIVVDGPVRAVMTESLVFAPQINKLLRDDRFLTVEDVLEQLTGDTLGA